MKSHCCNEDVIYLGKNIKSPVAKFLEGVYLYACSKCGRLEWTLEKEKCKYKWYKIDLEKLKKLLRGDYMDKFKVGDKVINNGLHGTIVEIKEQPSSALGRVYLIKYPIREIGSLFHRKLWTSGLGLKKDGDTHEK